MHLLDTTKVLGSTKIPHVSTTDVSTSETAAAHVSTTDMAGTTTTDMAGTTTTHVPAADVAASGMTPAPASAPATTVAVAGRQVLKAE